MSPIEKAIEALEIAISVLEGKRPNIDVYKLHVKHVAEELKRHASEQKAQGSDSSVT